MFYFKLGRLFPFSFHYIWENSSNKISINARKNFIWIELDREFSVNFVGALEKHFEFGMMDKQEGKKLHSVCAFDGFVMA